MLTVEIPIPELLVQEMTLPEIKQEVKENFVIRKYLKGELSMGEAANALGMTYVEAHEWMNAQGVASTRELPLDLKAITEKNREKFLKEV
ncbi:conserved hypothetical protein [Candidatus Magnetomoraceae bacterium gMMP-15]